VRLRIRASAEKLTVSRETWIGGSLTLRLIDQLPERCVGRLRRFVELLDRWRRITNLISEHSFADVWDRHIQDSIYIQEFGHAANRWLDLGTGAGFPGIVIGVLIAERERAQVHCVESDARKCAFLRTAIGELEIPVKVHNIRAEVISPAVTGSVDAVTARGFSSMKHILTVSHEYLSDGAIGILPRGRTSAREVETIDPKRYATEVRPNPGHKDGLIFVIRQKVGKP
jgi:16S rRNA (guanine527-N7)-methyltransferase